jgi:plasmid stability protein
MSTLTIRNIDDDLKKRLRIEAAQHGRSMEEEVRVILKAALNKTPSQQGLGSRIHQRFTAVDCSDFNLPERKDLPRAADVTE